MNPTLVLFALLAVAAAAAAPRFTSPKDAAPEYAPGLSAQDAAAGWIGLWDAEASSLWDGDLGDYEVRVTTAAAGEITVGLRGRVIRLPAGTSTHRVEGAGRGRVRLGKGAVVTELFVRPLNTKPLLGGNGKGGAAWKTLSHPTLPPERHTDWDALGGSLRAAGGLGCVEFPGEYRDFVLQVTVKTLKPLSNGGVFFRCVPGEFLNGYEAQVFNGCYDQDPARPARHATGAIDDRQNARRLISRDREPFTMTVIAAGPRLATWVNGVRVTDWADDRPDHDNPRRGRRLKAGTIQLQAHDKDTDVVFSNLRVATLESVIRVS